MSWAKMSKAWRASERCGYDVHHDGWGVAFDRDDVGMVPAELVPCRRAGGEFGEVLLTGKRGQTDPARGPGREWFAVREFEDGTGGARLAALLWERGRPVVIGAMVIEEGRVFGVIVAKAYRRRGVASELLFIARQRQPVEHARDLSEAGAKFVKGCP